MRSSTSNPWITLPNTVYSPFKWGCFAKVKKNWLPLVFGPLLAIANIPLALCWNIQKGNLLTTTIIGWRKIKNDNNYCSIKHIKMKTPTILMSWQPTAHHYHHKPNDKLITFDQIQKCNSLKIIIFQNNKIDFNQPEKELTNQDIHK